MISVQLERRRAIIAGNSESPVVCGSQPGQVTISAPLSPFLPMRGVCGERGVPLKIPSMGGVAAVAKLVAKAAGVGFPNNA